jgi:hypothetical protein
MLLIRHNLPPSLRIKLRSHSESTNVFTNGILLQITQQSLEPFLILIVFFPAREVANVPCALDFSCPGLLCFYNGIIKLHGEEHEIPCLMLFAERCFDFGFDPGAFDGVLGEDQQQFVVEPDGFVDAYAELVADFEVFWGVPAADVVRLQVGVETFGEGLIFTGV